MNFKIGDRVIAKHGVIYWNGETKGGKIYIVENADSDENGIPHILITGWWEKSKNFTKKPIKFRKVTL